MNIKFIVYGCIFMGFRFQRKYFVYTTQSYPHFIPLKLFNVEFKWLVCVGRISIELFLLRVHLHGYPTKFIIKLVTTIRVYDRFSNMIFSQLCAVCLAGFISLINDKDGSINHIFRHDDDRNPFRRLFQISWLLIDALKNRYRACWRFGSTLFISHRR